MESLIKCARLIDRLSDFVGKYVSWLVFVAIVVSALNATVRSRYTFSYSSNAYLELQWYLFSAVFLFCAGWALRRNDHVRIDVISSRYSYKVHAWIDILGGLFFLMPLCVLVLYESIPYTLDSIQSQEFSTNAGGLIVWPAKLIIPVGFLLLMLQNCAEIIKRIGVLQGLIDYREFEKQTHSVKDIEAEVEQYKKNINLKAGIKMDFIADIINNHGAPIIFVSLVLFLLSGYPVAFSLAAVGLFFAMIGIYFGKFSPQFLQALPNRIFGIMQNDTLLAIPFFTYMGLVLERTGMAEDLLDTIGQLFGRVRGGVAYAVICVGALLAATTGVVAASVISMGLISLPIMLRYGYDRRLATGVIAASGTLAQIIPPSLVLIIMADQLGRSVGDMYAGAFIPGLVLSGLYLLFVMGMTLFKPNSAPALPLEARTIQEINNRSPYNSLIVLIGVVVALSYGFVHYVLKTEALDESIIIGMLFGMALSFCLAVVNKLFHLGLLSNMCQRVIFVLIPPLLLIFLVLGTIFLGIATPTEGGAMGAVGAMIMAMVKKKINWNMIWQISESTAKLSSFVLFILIGSTVFALVFRGFDGDKWVEHLLTSLPGGQLGFLIAVNILFFCLAFFLDFFELAFILVPLVGPVAEKLGIDLIWFGVLLGVNMQTSFMHPPFGFALFYLRSVAPKGAYMDAVTKRVMEGITTKQIYWGAVPFVIIQCIMVGLIIFFPNLVQVEKPKVYNDTGLNFTLEPEANAGDSENSQDPNKLKFSTENGNSGSETDVNQLKFSTDEPKKP